MSELDHWHPVLLASRLGAKPVAVRLCGREIALFRGEGGRVGALVDCCPHRGMRLSAGWVEAGRLVCAYHAWSFDAEGAGCSPATPAVKACAEAFEACDRFGAIWVRSKGASTAFPEIEVAGHSGVCLLHHPTEARLEPLLDNFTEVEHTPTTHAIFGYPREALAEIETKVELTAETVRVINTGPQKRLPWFVSLGSGLRTGDRFTDDWTTRFSPVHAIYDQWWADPASGKPRGARLRIIVFFTPVTETRTDLFTFVSAPAGSWNPFGLRGLMNRLLARLVDQEVKLDLAMVAKLADGGRAFDGRCVGRFDLPLVENRKRIARIYRGLRTDSEPEREAATPEPAGEADAEREPEPEPARKSSRE